MLWCSERRKNVLTRMPSSLDQRHTANALLCRNVCACNFLITFRSFCVHHPLLLLLLFYTLQRTRHRFLCTYIYIAVARRSTIRPVEQVFYNPHYDFIVHCLTWQRLYVSMAIDCIIITLLPKDKKKDDFFLFFCVIPHSVNSNSYSSPYPYVECGVSCRSK